MQFRLMKSNHELYEEDSRRYTSHSLSGLRDSEGNSIPTSMARLECRRIRQVRFTGGYYHRDRYSIKRDWSHKLIAREV